MDNPKISLITISYNSEKTIRDTFESVRKQNYPNLEYILVDGGSKDSTLKIAEEYSDIITSIVSEPDKGISDAMNKGIRRVTGDLIGIIHSDDMLAENALNILAKEWDGISDIYYGHLIVCAEDGHLMHQLRSNSDLSSLRYGFCLLHPSTFVTKLAYDKYGTFDIELKCAMDYDLLLRFYTQGAKFRYIDQNLAVYRVGGTNMKMRKRTIDEVCEISIRHGGNRMKAYAIKYKKMIADKIRPLGGKMIHNKRVQKL